MDDQETNTEDVKGGLKRALSSDVGQESNEDSFAIVEDDHDSNNNLDVDEEDNGNPRDTSSSVRVAVRVRPLLPFEQGTEHCMQVMRPDRVGAFPTTIRIGSSGGPRFTFDQVFDFNTQQEQIFQAAVVPLVENCLEGYNATILAYGQTGSGKTHTIMGPPRTVTRRNPSGDSNSDGDDDDDDSQYGIIPRAFQNIFEALERKKIAGSEASGADGMQLDYQVSIQFLELYGEEIRDLLTGHRDKLTIRDLGTDEPEVVGATQQPVTSAEEALLCLTHGMLRRVTGATAMNESSSRSHAILSVLVEQQQTVNLSNLGSETPEAAIDPGSENHVQVTHSRFNFVDLAGSERQKRTKAEGKRLKEGIDINKGLLVLGNVISALGDPKKRGKTFVPYRDSKLTRLLKGSLGGNHKTLMIACVSPAGSNMEESLNCLRYANRAKNIQNNAVVNVDGNTRLVQELQAQVQVLATDLLRTIDTPSNDTAYTYQYPRHVLETMAMGGKYAPTTPCGPTSPRPSYFSATSPRPSSFAATPTSSNFLHNAPFSIATSPSASYHQNNNQVEELNRKLQEMEIELSKTQDKLRQSQSHHDAAEEELYAVKAQKEMAELQLSIMKDHGNTKMTIDGMVVEQAFQKKAASYEKEIGVLKNALQEAENKMDRMKLGFNQFSPSAIQEDDERQSLLIEQARKELEEERERLHRIQSSMDTDESNDNPTDSESMQVDRIDEEEKQDEAEIQNLTKKYLDESGHSDDDFDPSSSLTLSSLATPNKNTSKKRASTPSSTTSQRERKVQADLAELSRSISAKENLIDQLKLSQEKYASMRDFYEDRLREMEQVLDEKEREREHLLNDLKRLKAGDHKGSKELEAKLTEKEKHIATLRKKQRELKNLTAVSSRNDTEINRLQNDVQNMKRMKVDLQKKLQEERKSHAKQMKELQKATMQKERELTKVKKLSTQREIEAQRAQQIAKQRLEELGQLRTKYKDSEKKLRMASLKRGVLAKAGIDPVIVGRSGQIQGRQLSTTKEQQINRKVGTRLENRQASIDTDAMRAFFDKKVAGVVRKEAIVDKLAKEWEEHFELSNRKLEMEKANGDEELDEAQQAILIKIQFKEERIRQLATRVGKQDNADDKGKSKVSKSDTFLFDKDFAKICKGSKPDQAHIVAARVLFGMIVRERRRVSALARTASSLDARVQAAERAAELSEEALRSYMDEQRHELASLTQNQQEHILSLMDMVKEDSERVTAIPEITRDKGHSEELFQRKLLVLANERVALLEQQISELQCEATESDSYREKLEEMKESLTVKLQEYEDVQNDLIQLRSALRQIREVLHNRSDESEDDQNSLRSIVLDIVKGALDPNFVESSNGEKPKANAKKSPRKPSRNYFSSALQNFELSESEGENDETDDTPDWANDIMADLALIAEGKLPPSMENSPAIVEGASKLDKAQPQVEKSVFDRLSDPKQYTGTQKQARKKLQGGRRMQSPPSKRRDGRKSMSKEIGNRLEKIVVPKVDNDAGSGAQLVHHRRESNDSEHKAYQTVFDRLMSPSHYTGTQKEKFQETKQKRERTAEQVADRLLDGLLQSDVVAEEKTTAQDHTVPTRTVYSEYASQNVFERLQKTTTQAFAVKTQHGAILTEGHSQQDDASHDFTNATNERHPVRQASPIRETSGSDRHSHSASEKQMHSDYMRQDVFERLQKTTTEAYAHKAHRINPE